MVVNFKGGFIMELEKLTKKTAVDNKDFQYLGDLNQVIEMFKEAAIKYKKPMFLIMRSKENDEIGIFSFEGEIPKLEMPPIDFSKLLNSK